MGFEEGNRQIPATIQQAPDFAAALAVYQNKVVDLGVQIKMATVELDEVNSRLSEVKAALQAQYDSKVADLGDQIRILEAVIEDLKGKVASLETQVKERQAAKDSISLDNSAESQRLKEEWSALHRSSAELANAEKANLAAAKENAEVHNTLIADKQEFETAKAKALEGIDSEEKRVNALSIEAEATLEQAIEKLQEANAALNKVAQDKAALDLQLADATQILLMGDEIRKLSAQNKADQEANSAAALRNQEDANQIKIARVALNNFKQQLDQRAKTLSEAEQKVGG